MAKEPGLSKQVRSTSTNKTGSSTNTSRLASISQPVSVVHCDRPGYPSCYTLGFQDEKANPGSMCPVGHTANYCAGWNAAARQQPSSVLYNPQHPASLCTGFIGLPCPTQYHKEVKGPGTIRELAPGASPGPHTLEYIMAFNTASGNPYLPGTTKYKNYQAGLDDAAKAGRDCDTMDTCSGPNLLGNWINGVLHLDDKQYCGNGFGLYSDKLCWGFKGCTANSIGEVTCPVIKPGPVFKVIKETKIIHEQTVSSSRSSGLQQIPSNATDFRNDNPNAIKVQLASAKKNILGDYEIKGEITNLGNDTIKFVQITAHVYDTGGNLVGNENGYTTPSDLDPHHTGTFDLFITKDTLSGTPSSFRLSYDWS